MPSYELLQLASPQFYALLLIGFPTGSFILLIVLHLNTWQIRGIELLVWALLIDFAC